MKNQQPTELVTATPEAIAAFEEMRAKYDEYVKWSDESSWLSFSDFCRVEANY